MAEDVAITEFRVHFTDGDGATPTRYLEGFFGKSIGTAETTKPGSVYSSCGLKVSEHP